MIYRTTVDRSMLSRFAAINNRWLTKRPVRFFLMLIPLLLFTIELSGHGVWPSSVQPQLLPSETLTPPEVCNGYQKNASLVVVVKTGATEASRRIPWQLLSFLSCAKDDVFFFSDLEQTIGDIHLHDALENVAKDAKVDNTEFKLYEDQKKFVLEGQDLGRLSGRGSESWSLDKFKNIHTAQKAWQMRPKQSWYFFIDADTYVVWPSLFALLQQYDPREKIYLGSETNGEVKFGHGGSGYVLSRGVMEVLVGRDAKQFAHKFDVMARTGCCGDIELSKILLSEKIKVTNAHPMMNSDKPNTYRFTRLWCKPLITMHHIGAEEMNDLWQFEKGRMTPEKPLLFEELWTHFLEPKMATRSANWAKLSEDKKREKIPAERDDWENYSENITIEPPQKNEDGETVQEGNPLIRDGYKSRESCATACKQTKECFQYMHWNQTCKLSQSFRFGQHKEPDNGVRWKSGWDLDKIQNFKAENPCQNVDFEPYQQI